MPTAMLTVQERNTLLQSVNGRLPWREVNGAGEVVDTEGTVIDHDWSKAEAASATKTDELHKLITAEARVASEERQQLRKEVMAEIAEVRDSQRGVLREVSQLMERMELLSMMLRAAAAQK